MAQPASAVTPRHVTWPSTPCGSRPPLLKPSWSRERESSAEARAEPFDEKGGTRAEKGERDGTLRGALGLSFAITPSGGTAGDATDGPVTTESRGSVARSEGLRGSAAYYWALPESRAGV